MAWGLPKLPGFTFQDPTKTQHNLNTSLHLYQGYRMPSMIVKGPGGAATDVDSNAFAAADDSVMYDPSLTYGRVKQPALPAVIPHFVHYDKKCLKFGAFFKQPVFDRADEKFRVRIVNIIYFLEDDSITIMEPRVRNSGIWQGRIVKRAKIPKNDLGEYWTWKDLNVGIDMCIYGRVFHLVNCDLFTKEWLMSQGIELNKEEEMPEDPYIARQFNQPKIVPKPQKTHEDSLKKFLQNDGKVLTFDVVWDNREFSECGEFSYYKLLYFLVDDKITIKEVEDDKGGKEFPLLLKKTRVPKKWKERPSDFPAVSMELTENEVSEYYGPLDLIVGETLFILSRRFLIIDADQYTRDYYRAMYNINQPPRIELQKAKKKEYPRTFPPHIGIGTPEDSLQSCLHMIPKPPKKDVIKYALNANKNLRYLCELVAIHPEDVGRQFVLSYSLSDGKIKIGEIPRRNSGFMEGRFLKAMLLQTPESDPNFPTYMTPERFYIGAIIPVFKHRFKIIGCDLMVYRYMSANPEKFPQEAIDSVRNYHLLQGNLRDELDMVTREELEAAKRAEIQAIGESAPVQPTNLQKCLAALHVQEGNETPVRPPTPPATTDNLSYDEAVRYARMSKPPCEEVMPLKGILKSGGAELRDDHQKTVCFTGPDVRGKPGEPQPQPGQKFYPPGQQPLYDDDPDFCDRYADLGYKERKERREKEICAYEIVPKAESGDVRDDSQQKVLPGYLGTYDVDCKKTPQYMRLGENAFDKVKKYRDLAQEISPAAKKVADYPLMPAPTVATCLHPPEKDAGPCAPKKPEDVLFTCPHVEPILPCCDPDKRDKTVPVKLPPGGICDKGPIDTLPNIC